MIAVLEISEQVPQETEHKMLKQARRVLHFFNVDTAQWNKARLIKWIFSKLTLFIIVLGLGVYTAKTSFLLIQDYAQSPTSYIGQFMLNRSIALPPSVVGLPLSPYELDDYWAKQKSISPSEKASHYQNLLVNFFNDTKMTKDYLLSPDYHWPNYLLFVTYHYHYYILQFESLNGKGAIQSINLMNDSKNDLMGAVNILDDQLKNLKVSISDLKTKFGSEVKALFNFVIYYYTSSSEFPEDEVDSHFSNFDSGSIWYNARFDQYPLKEEECILIQAHRSDLPNPRPNDIQIHMNVGTGGSSKGQYDYWLSYFDSNLAFVPLQVASTYRSLPYRDGKQQCSENKPIDMCKSECRRAYFRQKCGCFATLGNMVCIRCSNTTEVVEISNCIEG